MKRIRDVLEYDISQGYINWEKLHNKIDVALKVVDNNFKVVREKGETKDFKTEDALTFKVKKFNTEFCYKIISPRTVSGTLFCSGIQYGTYDPITGKPVLLSKPRMF